MISHGPSACILSLAHGTAAEEAEVYVAIGHGKSDGALGDQRRHAPAIEREGPGPGGILRGPVRTFIPLIA